MIDFLNGLSRWLSPLWEMSVTAAYAAAVVIVLRLLLKKRAPKQVLCLLWLVVFARLLIPVSLESPLSIVPDALPGQEYAGERIPAGAETPVTPTVPQTPAQNWPQSQPGNVTPAISNKNPTLSVPEGVGPAASARPSPAAFPWRAVIAGVWLAGAAVLGVCALASYLRLRRRLFDAIRAKDGAWEHPAVYSPFILGIVRPRIYLPAGLMGQPRQFILCHERAHLRRLDHIVKPVCWIALALHWFNPLAWAAFLLMSRDIEAACDEAVVRRMGSEVKADYSDTLLALATGRRLPAPCPLAFDEGDAKGRIRNVLNYRRPALWAIVISVIAAALAAVCLLTDPVAAKESDAAPTDREDKFTPVYTLATGDGSGTVLVEGLGDAYVEWSGPDTSPSGGGWLYFTNPAFCCPSLAGKQVEGSALWADESRTTLGVVMNVNDDRVESGTVTGFYINFDVELSSGTVLKRVFDSEVEGETLELTDQEMVDMARALAELLAGAEDYYLSHQSEAGSSGSYVNADGIPAQVQADAEAFVRGRFEDLRDKRISYGIDGTAAYATDEIDLPELDDWRIESLTGPYWSGQTYWDILDVDRRVELWHVVYGYHSPTPDKAWTLANGGTNLTEDGWLTPINYGAEYLLYELGEDGSRTLLTVFGEQGEVSSVWFRRHIRAALAKDSMADTDFAMEDMEYPLSNLGRELDLNGNGVPEYAQVAEFGGQGQRLELWEGSGLIFAEEGYYVHAGYNAVFLCTLDGKDYLLRYHPYMGQGECYYEYQLFTLTRDGQEQVVRENSLEFDINFNPIWPHHQFDPEAIAAFMDEINDLLAHSVQLINTDDLWLTFQKEGRLYDSLSWLDEWEPVFARDESVSLLENLRAFQKAMEAEQYVLGSPVLTVMNETQENAHIQLRYEDKSTQFDADFWDYSFQPADQVNIQVLDLNGDGKNEIVFPLVWGHGTGMYIEKLYVFDAETLEQYDTSGLNEMILSSVVSTGDEDNFYLTVGGERVTVPKSKAQPKEDPDAFVVADKLSLGSIIRYTVEDGQVSCWLACDPSGMSLNYIGFLKITLELTPSGSFSCGSAQFVETDTPG